MKKSQLAEVLEDREYHVVEHPTFMCVFKHGNFICSIRREEESRKYFNTINVPEAFRHLVTTYGDM
ncbi:hypothetical protein VPHD51_0186 [Vibrio phage D51]